MQLNLDPRLNTFGTLFLVLLSAFLVMAGFAGVARAEQENDLLRFFKNALAVPPDVEYFAGEQHSLRTVRMPPGLPGTPSTGRPLFYEGARSGTNFFLRRLKQAPSSADLIPRSVVGRLAETNYHLNQNTITVATAGESEDRYPLESFNDASYAMISQFLQFGVGDLIPATVRWSGNTFSAKRAKGVEVFGSLETRRGLPSLLTMKYANGETVFKACSYEYPDPPNALSGFPHKITVLTRSDGALRPHLDLVLTQIKLAESELPSEHFAAAQFVTTNIVYTNRFSNQALHRIQPDGSSVEIQKDFKFANAASNRKWRTYAISAALIVVLAPVLLLFRSKPKIPTVKQLEP